MFSTFVLVIAGLLAGGVNAIAGGGTLLSFPALVWPGVPPIMANATATLTALSGYIGSAWAYRDDIKAEGELRLRTIVTVAACGGLIGAALLLATPGDAIQGHRCCGPVLSACGIGVVAAYGGYLNGGLGIMFLAVFGLIGFRDLHSMNGLKNLLAAVLPVVSVTTYATVGLIAWESAAVLAVSITVGGYIGAKYARRIKRTEPLRLAVIAVGAILTVLFFAE